MEAFVQSAICSLGYNEDGRYFREPDCFESIRDLIRFLRSDVHSATTRRLCGERNIVLSDLIPIMKGKDTPDNLFDIALRLAINLTQPSVVAFGGRIPENSDAWRTFLELERNLKRSKLAFADVDFMRVLKSKLAAYFHSEWTCRNEETKLVIERIIVLLKYVLAIGDTERDEQLTTGDANSQDRVVLAILDSGVGELVMEVASTPSEHSFHLPLLEIIALIIKQHEPRDLVAAGELRSEDQKEKDERELQRSVQQIEQKDLERRRRLGGRSTSFAGSYVVKGLKAINQDNDLIVQKVLKEVSGVEHLQKRKVKKRLPKNRRPFDCVQSTRVSTVDVRVSLRKFCVDVLQRCYNRLMSGCKDLAFGVRRTLGQRNADIHYFLLMRFFMEFRRLASLPAELVSATLGREAFHGVQIQLNEYLMSAQVQRKEGRIYTLRAQYAVAAYRELLFTLVTMYESGNGEDEAEVEATCLHVLRLEEYREMAVSIIRRYTPALFSKTFLRNLVLANHLYIRLLERHVKAGKLSKVSKRKKLRKRKKKRENFPEEETEEGGGGGGAEVDVDGVWENVCEQLSDVVNGFEAPNDDVSPIDSLLSVDDDVHQRFAMVFVQRALRERRVADGVGIYRAARSIFPANGDFGTDGMNPEDEFIELRAIFFADLSQVETELEDLRKRTYGEHIDKDGDRLFDAELGDAEGREEGGEESESDDDEQGTRYVTNEVDFNFDGYVENFARADVLKWYVFLLEEYETNSAELNKAILKLLHRVAFDLKGAAKLFQLSLFRVLMKVGNAFKDASMPEIKRSPHFELYQFGFHLLKAFFSTYNERGSKLIPELLFWKTQKEAFDLRFGYGSYENIGGKEKSKEELWPEELDNEIRTLHEEFVGYDEKPEDIDVAEFIEHNLSRARTRKQIIREMKSLGLDTFGAKTNKRSVASKTNLLFAPDLLERLRNLAEEYNATAAELRSSDLVDFIRGRLPERFSRVRIIKQLNYAHIHFSPKRKVSKPSKPWPEELLVELKSLYEQYRELDEKPAGDLVDYVMCRLSQKKSRRDVTRKLEDIGVDASFIAKEKRRKKSGFELFTTDADEGNDRERSTSSPGVSEGNDRGSLSPGSEDGFALHGEHLQRMSSAMSFRSPHRSSRSSNGSLSPLDKIAKETGEDGGANLMESAKELLETVDCEMSSIGATVRNDNYDNDDRDDEDEIVVRKRSARSISPLLEDSPVKSAAPAKRKRIVSDDDDE